MEVFAKTLMALRQEKDLTQAQLAKELGFNTSTVIANWESGKRIPSAENLMRIAKFFGVSIDYLFGLKDS